MCVRAFPDTLGSTLSLKYPLCLWLPDCCVDMDDLHTGFDLPSPAGGGFSALEFVFVPLMELFFMGWGHGSVVKNTCSCKGPSLGDPMPSDLHAYQTRMHTTYVKARHTDAHKIEI